MTVCASAGSGDKRRLAQNVVNSLQAARYARRVLAALLAVANSFASRASSAVFGVALTIALILRPHRYVIVIILFVDS